jgi:hypothetical protein
VFYISATTINNYSDVSTGGKFLEYGTIANMPWGCSTRDMINARGTAIGTGAQNTFAINSNCADGLNASKYSIELVLGGKSDWFLPSIDELRAVCNQGGCTTDVFWSSSQLAAPNTGRVWVAPGIEESRGKGQYLKFRPIRAFG